MGAWCRFRQWWSAWWADSKGSIAVGASLFSLVILVIAVAQAMDMMDERPVVDWGNIWEPFAAVGTIGAVVVALWQSVVIGRQAKNDAREAASRFQSELEAANARTVQEVEAAERRFQREEKAAAERHQAELETQREVARVQRIHLREQEFKLALIRVSRAANAYTHQLATLVAETERRIHTLPTRQERDDAITPIAKTMNLATHDLTLEVSGAHMLTNNDELHDALDDIMQAATDGPLRAQEYQNAIVMTGAAPNPLPVYMVMQSINEVVGDARRLAGRLLVTGWD